MNPGILLQSPLLSALGIAVLHSLWQGILLYFVVKLIVSVIPREWSAVLYSTAYSALVVLFGLFLYTFFTEWRALAAVPVSSLPANEWATAEVLHPETGSAAHAFLLIPDAAMHLLERLAPCISILYTGGVILLFCKMVWQLMAVRALRRGLIYPDASLQDAFQTLKNSVCRGSRVVLRLSEKVKAPLMLGIVKPLILLPLSLASHLEMQQLEAVLLHELAHVKRRDYLWNMIQILVETLLFFNPAAWWLSAMARREREHCCDDFVLRVTQQSLPYAQALLALEEFRLASYSPVLSAAGTHRSHLFNRIKRMTTMKKNHRSNQKTLASVTVLVLAAAMACFATAFSQGKTSSKTNEAQSGQIRERGTEASADASATTDFHMSENGAATAKEEDGEEAVSGTSAGTAKPQSDKDVSDKVARALEESEGAISGSVSAAVTAAFTEASKAVDDLDWKAIDQEVQDGLREARRSMKEVDWSEIDRAMEEARQEMRKAMKELNEELRHMKTEVGSRANREALKQSYHKAIVQQREAIDNYKVALKRQQQAAQMQVKALSASQDAKKRSGEAKAGKEELISRLEADGLLDRSRYSIRYEDEKLYINDKEQPKSVASKYARYFSKGSKVMISGSSQTTTTKVDN